MTTSTPTVTELARRVAALEATIETLVGKLNKAARGLAAYPGLAKRVAELEQRVP